MKRFMWSLLLGCILLQACGSPALDATRVTPNISAVQPPSATTMPSLRPPAEQPAPASPANGATPTASTVLPTTVAASASVTRTAESSTDQTASSFPDPCSYPIAGVAPTLAYGAASTLLYVC